jgi:superfamily II DNA or RNA helicase
VLVPLRAELGYVTVRMAEEQSDGGWDVVVASDLGTLSQISLSSEEADQVVPLERDGTAPSERVLAGMWTQWMSAAATNARTSLLASTTLVPYAHQSNAVYGAMLPQPFLRFLLADEPGTGKTIMAGLYLREMQRLGLIKRALIVCPANLATKWQADFDRFFGGGLRRITADSVREHALDLDHDMWVVSLELAAVNGAVQDAIRPDRAGWDVVVFDEAHRLTPTAASFHQVGRLLAHNTPRALLMTATPHRGSEWLFRHLLHLVDSDIYPDPGSKEDPTLSTLSPGPIHFLRRMKEDLLDHDGRTRLFRGRTAKNFAVPLSSKEYSVYAQALDMVDLYFPRTAQPLARMVYGKRAASSLKALKETLKRRAGHMGEMTAAEAKLEIERDAESDEEALDEAEVVHAASNSSKAERSGLRNLIAQIDAILMDVAYVPSKWRDLIQGCFAINGIAPGSSLQAVVFTEYADSAEWIVSRLHAEGYSARMYSGRQSHLDRDAIRDAFMRGEYQVIVTTDAGNEGIDLQAAHVLVNYDIPWSLVKLEQRMGRIHRVGQTRDVFLYNLIALDTREGDTLHKLLENFVTAANELGGQMFDSLSAVAEISGINYDKWLSDLYGDDDAKKQRTLDAVAKIKTSDVKRAAQLARNQESALASQVDAMAALTLMQSDLLERVNPAIVDAYLDKLDRARLLQLKKTSSGDGIVHLAFGRDLAQGLSGQQSVLVATSGQAIAEATMAGVDTSRVLPLGPGEEAFTELIDRVSHTLDPDMYRGGAVSDLTSITGYDLYAYRGELMEAGGKRTTAWAALIRVNESGSAYPIRWESLANLVPSELKGARPHPAREEAATVAARVAADRTLAEHQRVRNDWFARARNDLRNLPIDLTIGIENREERQRLRASLEHQTTRRLAELESLSQVSFSVPRLVGRITVYPAAASPTVEEKNSEMLAMRHVRELLESDGWSVDDVHSENRGYDMLAVRGAARRLVEVKGVWSSAASDGVRMTGNEVLIATQHRSEFWLYVVDTCSNGRGVLFGAYQDPTTLFSKDMSSDAIFRVPGSSLAGARSGTQEHNQ